MSTQCAYCGGFGRTTRDHVIPRGLFVRPLPRYMVTVPACHACNATKARHDDFLRDLLTCDVAGCQSPIAQEVFRTKVRSSVRQGKSLLARIAVAEGRETPIITRSGLYVGDCYVARFDLQRAVEMFSLIVRGLYFHLRRIILPEDCTFDVARLAQEDVEKCWAFFLEYRFHGPFRLGDGVFSCFYQQAAEDEATTFWLLEFYERIYYRVVSTSRPEMMPRLMRGRASPVILPPWQGGRTIRI